MIELKVAGMSCQHCVAAVTRSIRLIDAQARVDVDLAQGRVRIDSTQPAEALKTAVGDAGYQVVA